MQFNVGFFLNFVFSPPAALLHGLAITVFAAIISMFIGVMLGGLLAMAGLSKFIPLRWFNQLFIGFFRGTPVLVQLVLIYFGLPSLMGGIDLFPPAIPFFGIDLSGALVAGIVTFSLHEAAYMSEIIRAGILSIDIGQWEAAKSLGMTPLLTMKRIIMPQALRVIVPPLGNQFNIMFKTTSLLSVIAVPELFHVADAIQSATYRTFEVYLGVAVYYIALTAIWTLIQRRLERRVSRGYCTGSSTAKVSQAQNVTQDQKVSRV
jgi:polar amino acid transport system permease protein